MCATTAFRRSVRMGSKSKPVGRRVSNDLYPDNYQEKNTNYRACIYSFALTVIPILIGAPDPGVKTWVLHPTFAASPSNLKDAMPSVMKRGGKAAVQYIKKI